MTVNQEELELRTLIERLHNPYYTTKDIIDAVLYLLHRERNSQLSLQNMMNSPEYQEMIEQRKDLNLQLDNCRKSADEILEEHANNSINNLNETVEDVEYRNKEEKL